MLPISVKVGSVLVIPIPAGVTVQSNDTAILTVATAGNRATITALRPGVASILAAYGSDLTAGLKVSVVQ